MDLDTSSCLTRRMHLTSRPWIDTETGNPCYGYQLNCDAESTVALIYYEDVVLGKPLRHGPYKVTERDIIDFATQWEPRPHHIDPVAARETALGGLTAAGPHLVSICYRLCAEVNYLGEDRLAGIAALGMEVRWLQYVRPGDELMLHRVATEKRLSKSRPGTGIIVHENTLHNQKGERVFVMIVTALYDCRPAPG